jgi:hypothetical protein
MWWQFSQQLSQHLSHLFLQLLVQLLLQLHGKSDVSVVRGHNGEGAVVRFSFFSRWMKDSLAHVGTSHTTTLELMQI